MEDRKQAIKEKEESLQSATEELAARQERNRQTTESTDAMIAKLQSGIASLMEEIGSLMKEKRQLALEEESRVVTIAKISGELNELRTHIVCCPHGEDCQIVDQEGRSVCKFVHTERDLLVIQERERIKNNEREYKADIEFYEHCYVRWEHVLISP